jgi:threonine/homoserine/homoserine lactone efflux protein
MAHMFVGLLLLAVGVWGVFEEYYFVVDFVKGAGPIVLMLVGLLAALAGCVSQKKEEEEDNG